MTKVELAKSLKLRRQICGLTQSGLASSSGVSLPLIQILESQRGNPTLDVLSKILKSLGIELKLQTYPTDWEYLAQFGLPILNPVKKKNSEKYTWDPQTFAEQLKFAVAEVHSLPQKNERYKEALLGLLLALKEHYPKKAASLGLRPLFRLCKSPVGRVIKLKRIALGHLQKYL